MKSLLYLSLCSILFVACDSSHKMSKEPMLDPVMHFDPAVIDLGTVKKGEVKKMTFPFTNTSKENLQIDFADAGCHCTEIDAPEAKIFQSGGKGIVVVTYYSDREEELGEHEKTPLIILNRNDPETGSNMIREIKFRVNLIE